MNKLRAYFNLLALCLRNRSGLVAVTLFIVIIHNLLSLSLAKVIGLYIDAEAGKPLTCFGWSLAFLDLPGHRAEIFIALLLGLGLALWGLTYGRLVLQAKLGQGALYDLRHLIYNTMQSLSFAYHDRAHSSTLISNVVEDVGHAQRFFQVGIFTFVEIVFYIILGYSVCVYICPPAGLAAAGMATLSFSGTYFYFRYGYKYFANTRGLFKQAVSTFSENIEGQLVVRAFGRQQQQIARYNQEVTALHDATFREIVLFSLLNQCFLIGNVLAIPVALLVALGEIKANAPGITAATLFMLSYIQFQICGRSRALSRMMELNMRFSVAANRLEELFAAHEYLDDCGTQRLNKDTPNSLRLDKVSFAYAGHSPSLTEVDLTIRPGETIGLVGASGSGKSTLILLLCRFYDPDAGTVYLGESDIREYALGEMRDQFALVFQETFLFSASIRDNISYGSPDAPFAEIVHAATIAQAHDFIMAMPEGYDTEIGERGVTLSGGQRQRLSIARALLRRPRFLVLDDCTSALDLKTEKAIQDGLVELGAETTKIIIAHRYSSLAQADRVFVLENGRIVEVGSPRELNVPGTVFSRVLQTSPERTA